MGINSSEEPQPSPSETEAQSDLQLVARDLDDKELLGHLTDRINQLGKAGTKVVALVGGPASGKSMLATALGKNLAGCEVISTDDYVRGTRAFRVNEIERRALDPLLEYDFDFMGKQVEAVRRLKKGESIRVPQYNSRTGVALSSDPDEEPNPEKYTKEIIGPVNYLLIEGDFQPLKRENVDLLIYYDVPDNIRLENRVARDLRERGGASVQEVIDNFNFRQETQTKPHTFPNRVNADLVISVKAERLEILTPGRLFQYKYDLLEHQSPPKY